MSKKLKASVPSEGNAPVLSREQVDAALKRRDALMSAGRGSTTTQLKYSDLIDRSKAAYERRVSDILKAHVGRDANVLRDVEIEPKEAWQGIFGSKVRSALHRIASLAEPKAKFGDAQLHSFDIQTAQYALGVDAMTAGDQLAKTVGKVGRAAGEVEAKLPKLLNAKMNTKAIETAIAKELAARLSENAVAHAAITVLENDHAIVNGDEVGKTAKAILQKTRRRVPQYVGARVIENTLQAVTDLPSEIAPNKTAVFIMALGRMKARLESSGDPALSKNNVQSRTAEAYREWNNPMNPFRERHVQNGPVLEPVSELTRALGPNSREAVLLEMMDGGLSRHTSGHASRQSAFGSRDKSLRRH